MPSPAAVGGRAGKDGGVGPGSAACRRYRHLVARPRPATMKPNPIAVAVGLGVGVGVVGVGVGVGWFFTTLRMMVVLVGIVVPACGLCWTTVPSGSPGLDTSSTWTLLKPWLASSARAASTCWLIT